jgi:hypothetical protein
MTQSYTNKFLLLPGTNWEINIKTTYADGTYWEYMIHYTSVVATCYAAIDPAGNSVRVQVHQDLLAKHLSFPGFTLTEFIFCGKLWLNLYCLIQLIYGTLQLIHVGLRIHSPREWPPLFGSLEDIYSVGSFWR